MIELNESTKQDFLDIEYVTLFNNVKIDMSDAKYCIVKYPEIDKWFVDIKHDLSITEKDIIIYPTYTLSELLSKLKESLHYNIDDNISTDAKLEFKKQEQLYKFGYYFDKNIRKFISYPAIEGSNVNPLYAAADLLIECYKNKNIELLFFLIISFYKVPFIIYLGDFLLKNATLYIKIC